VFIENRKPLELRLFRCAFFRAEPLFQCAPHAQTYLKLIYAKKYAHPGAYVISQISIFHTALTY